jgi:hypothetical protein
MLIFWPQPLLWCVNGYIYIQNDNHSQLETQKNTLKTTSSSTNIFDDLPSLRPPTTATHRDELANYLSTERELHINDGLIWWHERKHIYPRLSRMALDYLSIPGKLSLFILLMELVLTYTYLLQPRLCMSNERSARAGCCSHMYVVVCPFSLHVPSCV